VPAFIRVPSPRAPPASDNKRRKAPSVAKLRLARDRIRKRDGKCEGRKSHAEERPEAVALANRLHKQGMGYRAIGAELAKAGHVNERGKPFPPSTGYSEIGKDPTPEDGSCGRRGRTRFASAPGSGPIIL